MVTGLFIMEKIEDIRRALRDIDGTSISVPPEASTFGAHPGLRTLWDPRDKFFDKGETVLPRHNDINEDKDSDRRAFDEIFEYGAEIDTDLFDNVMGGDAGNEIKTSLMVKGVDALAFYVPFHVRGGQWGIYIPVSSIAYMMTNVFKNIDAAPIDLMRMSIRAMHQHELFHFAVEYAFSQCELLTEKSVYKELITKMNDPQLGYRGIEEGLANANMIRSFWGRSVKGKTAALKSFVKMQPAGYNTAHEFTNRNIYERRCSDYISMYYHFITGIKTDIGIDGYNLLPPHPIDWSFCPVHIINDDIRLNFDPSLIDFFAYVNQLHESEKFKKQLKKLSSQIQQMWTRTKTKLAHDATASGLDFKQWEKNQDSVIYSVRVNRNFRAHLEYKRIQKYWLCLNIGDHKSMGHG
jgi:hypothetical protein